MAYYDYECNICGTFEIEKSMDAPHPVICPRCENPGLRRVYSPLSFSGQFKEHVRSNPPVDPPAGTEIRPRS